MKLRLEICPPGQPPYAFEHTEERADAELCIGRDPACTLSMAGDTCQNVSWHHASVRLTPTGAFVADLRSSNGTFLNGERITTTARLHLGDQISLGRTGPSVRIAGLDLTIGYTPTSAEKAVAGRENTVPSVPRKTNGSPAGAARDAGLSPTRRLLVSLQSRQRRMWFLFSLGISAVVIGVILALVALNKRIHLEIGPEIYERTLPSIAWVRGELPGTGSLIDCRRKLLLTAYHVVGTSEKVDVYFPVFEDGKVVTRPEDYLDKSKMKPRHAKVVESDPSLDLALLELDSVPNNIPELRLASSSSKTGESLHTVGNPADSGRLWGYTSGTVRGVVKKKDYRLQTPMRPLFLTACMVEMQNPINGGDSGGPVVNNQGELVGVNSHKFGEGQLMTAAIDVSEVWVLIGRLKNKEQPRPMNTSKLEPSGPNLEGSAHDLHPKR